MFLNVSTLSLRLLAMDSSVSPTRKVYGRVPEPPCFAAFVIIVALLLAPALFLFSFTNFPRFCPILFPQSVEEFCILKPFVFAGVGVGVVVKLLALTTITTATNKGALSLFLSLLSTLLSKEEEKQLVKFNERKSSISKTTVLSLKFQKGRKD